MTRSLRRLEPPLRVATSVVVTLGVLAAAASIGMSVGLPQALGGTSGGSALDYGRGAGGAYSPLRAGYIESVLGGGTLLPLREGTGSEQASATREPARTERDEPQRVVEVHDSTNDHRAAARDVPSVPFTGRTRTVGATRESDDPRSCSSTGPTVWYRFTPGHDRALIAYTFGTDHPIALAVFAGNTDRQVACDTDANGNSLVAFRAEAGTAYLFQLTAPLGGGNLVFSLDPQGTTTLASRSSSGDEPNGGAGLNVQVSADGRYVAFTSDATNLAPGVDGRPCQEKDPLYAHEESGPCPQLYVHDRVTGGLELISRAPNGKPADSRVARPFMSESGRYLTYESAAGNLVAGDGPGWDLFVFDRTLQQTQRLPITSPDAVEHLREQYNNYFNATISEDGRYVSFDSPSSHLVPGDTNGETDAFVYDRTTDVVERVSVSSSGEQMGRRTRFGSVYPSLSADGRYVWFLSDAANLVPGDTNGFDDIFVHDRLTRRTERVSIATSGAQTDAQSWPGGGPRRRISADGRFVVFSSSSSNLAAGDKNNGPDLFVRDRVAGTTTVIGSVTSSAVGRPPAPRGVPWTPTIYSISADGRYIAFDSTAPRLAPGDDDEDWDVFLHDLATRTTTLLTLSPNGGDLSGQGAGISADGRVAAYMTGRVVERETDTNPSRDGRVFVYEAPRAR